jgi:hypothetical protein
MKAHQASAPSPAGATLSPGLRLIAPIIAYLLVSVAATWPLAIRWRGWVPGFGDWGQNMWALWWTRESLLTLKQSPFFTHYLFYPEGVTLLFHPLDVADGLLTLPLYGLVGGDISYNLIVLLSFVLSGLGVYYLGLELGQRREAAFVAGLAFTLMPYHFLRLELGHLNLSSSQWIPFYLLFLFKFVRGGRSRFAFLAVLFMILNALGSWYYVMACGLVSLAGLTWGFGGTIAWPRQMLRVAVVLFLAVLALSPLLRPMFQLLDQTEWVGEHNPLRHSVDVLSFWVPGPPSTWAVWFEDIWISYAAQNREPGASAYLGYSVLVLSLIGLAGRRRKQVWWWLMVGLGFAMLALGPQLQMDGEIFEVKLPYYYLDTFVPGFSISGIPGRFVVLTSLAMAVSAGYGLSELMRRWPRQASLLGLTAALLVSLEFLATPVSGSDTALPQFYAVMAAENQSYTVIDLKWDANYLLHAQTVHGKPLVGGWLARLPKDQAAYLDQGGLDKAFLYLLLGPEGQAITDPATLQSALQTALTKRNVRYIIAHQPATGQWLEQFVGWQPVLTASDAEEITIYAATP